jgi:hypothetical protein
MSAPASVLPPVPPAAAPAPAPSATAAPIQPALPDEVEAALAALAEIGTPAASAPAAASIAAPAVDVASGAVTSPPDDPPPPAAPPAAPPAGPVDHDVAARAALVAEVVAEHSERPFGGRAPEMAARDKQLLTKVAAELRVQAPGLLDVQLHEGDMLGRFPWLAIICPRTRRAAALVIVTGTYWILEGRALFRLLDGEQKNPIVDPAAVAGLIVNEHARRPDPFAAAPQAA